MAFGEEPEPTPVPGNEPMPARPDGTVGTRGPGKMGRVLGWVMLGAGVLILSGMAWVGWRGYQAYSHLQKASAEVGVLQDQLTDVGQTDGSATAATVRELQGQAAIARSAVDDPVFRAATFVPFLGANLDAIRQVTVTVDSLATDVMPSLVDIAQTLRPEELTPTNGTLNLAPIERIAPLLQTADTALTQARTTMAGIDRSSVVQPIGEAVGALWGKLDQAAGVIGPGARIARLLPPMLGSDGPRTYLVVFQNSAELRATGGIFGSFALVTADQGTISILDQGASSRTLTYMDPPVAELSTNERNLYSQLMAQYPQDVNFTPDFPTAASLFAQMYRLHSVTSVDGVLAIDPVALSYTLKGSPPLDVGEGVTVTADNLVATLLSTAYAQFDKGDQSHRDDFLAHATAEVFSSVMTGQGDPRAIVSGLRKAAGERRILVYSAHPEEQADIARTGVSGAINADLTTPSIGVFFNDGTGAKLGYYLTNEVTVTPGECRTDGRRELEVNVVMHYSPPTSGLPSEVVGYTPVGQAYTLRTNVLVFAPVGGGVVDATERDGVAVSNGRGQDHAREVGTVTVELDPGESTQLTFTVLAPAAADGAPRDVQPQLILTPGVSPSVTSVQGYQDCRVATS